MRIRDFQLSDAQPVRDLALRCWRHTYADIYSGREIDEFIGSFYSDEVNAVTLRMMRDGTASYQVLILDDEVAGFQTASIADGAELRRLYVDPPLIGKGYGKALLLSAEAYFRSCMMGRYTVKVHERNSLGIGFYSRQGFLPVGREDSDLIYEKFLGQTGGPRPL